MIHYNHLNRTAWGTIKKADIDVDIDYDKAKVDEYEYCALIEAVVDIVVETIGQDCSEENTIVDIRNKTVYFETQYC